MPPIITNNAVITCVHGGLVTLIPKQSPAVIRRGVSLEAPAGSQRRLAQPR